MKVVTVFALYTHLMLSLHPQHKYLNVRLDYLQEIKRQRQTQPLNLPYIIWTISAHDFLMFIGQSWVPLP